MKKYIEVLSVDVTDRCNLCCRHCFNYSGTRKLNAFEMSDESFLCLIQQITDLEIASMCFCGGEPMIRKQLIFESMDIINKSNTTANMVSNGYYIGFKEAREIKDSGIGSVQISLDGFKESHDWLRNKEGSYERAIDAIINLKSVDCRVNIAFTPTKKNIGDIEDFVKMIDEMGISMLRMQPIMNMGRAKNIFEYFPSNEDYFILARKISLLRKQYKKMNIEWGDPTTHLQSISSGKWIKSVSITAYGDILISPYIPISFGNVCNHTLQEYVDGGLCDIVNNEFIKTIAGKINDSYNMDISKNSNLPGLYESELLKVDILDEDWELKISKIGC